MGKQRGKGYMGSKKEKREERVLGEWAAGVANWER